MQTKLMLTYNGGFSRVLYYLDGDIIYERWPKVVFPEDAEYFDACEEDSIVPDMEDGDKFHWGC